PNTLLRPGRSMTDELNWADVIDRDYAYVVLSKENRLQVIARPARKQLRQRGKRGWSVVAAFEAAEGDGPAPPDLLETIREALLAMTGRKDHEDGKPRRKKKRPASQAG